MGKISVAVLGATGNIGQRFVSLLQDHPYFRIEALCSSERTQGNKLGTYWRLEGVELMEDIDNLLLEDVSPKALAKKGIEAVFSGLPTDIAGPVERQCSEAGIKVFSNAASHRMDEDVPLLIPEVNPDHLELVKSQPTAKRGGFIVTNSNCSIAALMLPLKPLSDNFEFDRVFVSSYQALSGAGYPGVPSLDISGNVLPFIEKEEEKMHREAKKLLGRLERGRVVESSINVQANCARVPVRDGHLEAVTIVMDENVSAHEVADVLDSFKSLPQTRKLPTAPEKPVIVRKEPNRPQPILDAYAGTPERAKGMAATVGRIRAQGDVLRFFVLSHNTLRGGAGGSVLNAELAYSMGVLG